ncbi:E3 ubiquitin-protein ligase TRIM39-like [Lampris incognitus]|uniref:E3 ubiquitin-protein ligase TRIM39-like n=1 Tax=Lampris incognitus TaxID=2546036 RepID=UPI0024B49375|nr:E3 ubiquitin-protein ligase TRIM39-like [Lampris incognitus]
MACSGNFLPEKQFQCPLCLQVLVDPVTTPCGHTFCKACIQSAWDSSEVYQCATCERSFSPRPELNVSVAFKELADLFRTMAVGSSATAAQPGEVVCDMCTGMPVERKALKSCLLCLVSYCEAHLEPHRRVPALRVHALIEPVLNLGDRVCERHGCLLEVFCRDEQICVCRFCSETEHKGHSGVTLEEASRERKVQMKKTEAEFERMIQERLEKVEEIKRSVALSRRSSEEERETSDRLFMSVMRSVETRQAEVNADMEEKLRATERRAQDLLQELEQEINDLQRRNAQLGQLEHTDDHLHVLQTYNTLSSLPPTKDWSEFSVHSDVCVGTLRNAISQLDAMLKSELDALKKQELKRMQKYAVDVVLDPDTAHPNIVLSADGKQASRGDLLHVLPDNPQRFDPVLCVLGKKGFLSGRFYFQVEVGTKTFWDLGVVRESINRKGMITSTPENGYWTVRLRSGDEYRALESPSILLHLREKPRTVGVSVDYEEGTVSFFNVETQSHIYSFTGCSFAGRLFPFLSPSVSDDGRNAAPLVIAPVSHEVDS